MDRFFASKKRSGNQVNCMIAFFFYSAVKEARLIAKDAWSSVV